MIHNISGHWLFSEEFECGVDKGVAYFEQNGNTIEGYLEYEETIEGEEPFLVKQTVSGSIKGNHLNLKGIKATSPDGTPINNYNIDILEGTYTHEGKIVGHSFDIEDICGVFVLARK